MNEFICPVCGHLDDIAGPCPDPDCIVVEMVPKTAAVPQDAELDETLEREAA